jgi:hypothetical protein
LILQKIYKYPSSNTDLSIKDMRTTKEVSIVTMLIVAGLLLVATTSNTVFALSISGTPTGSSSSASSFISQTNDQSNLCVAGTTNTNSCNQSASNLNTGNAVSDASGGSGASSGISQSNTQKAICIAGTSNTNSCNQSAQNINTGNAVSASDGSGGSGASSGISQSNTQKAVCIAGTSNSDSCNQAALNFNSGNVVSAASGSDPNGGGSGASSGISQSNTQNAFCLAGTSNSGSCNQVAANINFGNVVSAALTR